MFSSHKPNMEKTQTVSNFILEKSKIYFSLFTLIFFVILFINLSSAFSGTGTGSVSNPFQITNCTQLQEINLSVSSQYILVNNIDCPGFDLDSLIYSFTKNCFDNDDSTSCIFSPFSTQEIIPGENTATYKDKQTIIKNLIIFMGILIGLVYLINKIPQKRF